MAPVKNMRYEEGRGAQNTKRRQAVPVVQWHPCSGHNCLMEQLYNILIYWWNWQCIKTKTLTNINWWLALVEVKTRHLYWPGSGGCGIATVVDFVFYSMFMVHSSFFIVTLTSWCRNYIIRGRCMTWHYNCLKVPVSTSIDVNGGYTNTVLCRITSCWNPCGNTNIDPSLALSLNKGWDQ